MKKTHLTKLLNQAGLDAEALVWPGTGTKEIVYYHIDKKGIRLDKPVTKADLKKALDIICEDIHYHNK